MIILKHKIAKKLENNAETWYNRWYEQAGFGTTTVCCGTVTVVSKL